MHGCFCSSNHSILYTGDNSIDGNGRNNRGASYNDSHNNSAMRMAAMDASMMDSNPSTMKSAIWYRKEDIQTLQ